MLPQVIFDKKLTRIPLRGLNPKRSLWWLPSPNPASDLRPDGIVLDRKSFLVLYASGDV